MLGLDILWKRSHPLLKQRAFTAPVWFKPAASDERRQPPAQFRLLSKLHSDFVYAPPILRCRPLLQVAHKN